MNKNNEKNIEEKTESESLYDWLKITGYTKGNFKYDDVLKTRLDKLKEQYNKEKNIAPEEYIRTIEKYCKMYEEWPKQKEIEKKADEKTGTQLYHWLRYSGYTKGTFKYDDVLKTRLDKLKEQYNTNKIRYSDSEENSYNVRVRYSDSEENSYNVRVRYSDSEENSYNVKVLYSDSEEAFIRIKKSKS